MTQSNRKLWFWVIFGTAFFAFLYLISSILLPFVAGMMIAYFLDPAADWLERKGCSRMVATGILIFGFFAILILTIAGLSPVLYQQFIGLMKAMPGYIEKLREFAELHLEQVLRTVENSGHSVEAREAVSKASGTLFEMATNFITGLFVSGVAIVNLIALVFLTPVVAFFLLRDFDVIVAHLDGLLPRDHAPVIREQVREMDNTIAGYLRGQVNVCLLLALFYAVGMSLCGLNYAILVGILSGLISFIPFVGAMTGFVVAILIAVFQFDSWLPILLVAGVYGLGQFLEGNILVPNLIGDKVGLHPAWVIFGMLAGGAILGFVGVLLSVPITAVIGVLVRFAVGRYRASMIYRGKEGGEAPRPAQKVLTEQKRQQMLARKQGKKAAKPAEKAAETTPKNSKKPSKPAAPPATS